MRALVVLLGLLLAACSSSYLVPRQNKAAVLAEPAGWQQLVVRGGRFDTLGFAPATPATDGTLAIYLESDGLAYLDRYTVSADPTPDDPLALRLALAHPGAGRAAWLARPCQYPATTGRTCDPAYWTSRRYAPEIVEALDRAIEETKRRAGAARLVLVGYSGGGALAVLLAARRSDVAGLVTVAANLDLAYWVARDRLAPLTGSLDPAEVAPRVASIPQLHLAGGRDDVVGPDVARAFLRRMGEPNRASLVAIPDFSHRCCWVEQWPRLLPEWAR